RAESVHSIEDLEGLPFTSKLDLLNTPENAQKARDFVLIPDEATLSRRPSTVWHALTKGREAVKAGFEREFRPIFMTSTTGRSAARRSPKASGANCGTWPTSSARPMSMSWLPMVSRRRRWHGRNVRARLTNRPAVTTFIRTWVYLKW